MLGLITKHASGTVEINGKVYLLYTLEELKKLAEILEKNNILTK